MKNDNTVIINGQKYDSSTGLPVEKSVSQPKNTKNSIRSVHSLAQKPKTLKTGRSMDIARSKSVSHFASRVVISSVEKPTSTKQRIDVKSINHPLAARVEKMRLHAKNSPTNSIVSKSAKVIKQEAIDEALDKSSKMSDAKIGFFRRHAKFINIFSIGIILLIIAGYFVYLNMPSISVRIASVQAEINATYPEYSPDGYSVNGPVLYSNGEVVINFKANTGNGKFVIKQSKSSWDSSAVKIQVDKDSNNDTLESKEGGLTIYTYNNGSNAAWVNGGILYTITGNAKLSGEQIRHIATSL